MVVEGSMSTRLCVSGRAHYLLNPKCEHLFLPFAVPSTLSDLNLCECMKPW